MGERKLAANKTKKAVAAACQEAVVPTTETADEAMRVQTPGGVFSVRWDERGSATALGQLAFFAEYLEATGLFEGWLKSCPLNYTSPNAPALVDVLGTWMLSILDGHCRYANVGALRGDGVAPDILGMKKIIGDDSLRRALGAIAPAPDAKHSAEQRTAQQAQHARSVQWMQEQLKHSIAQATTTPWILDCDTTVKVLYGKQDGAVVSYNPHKPGRPSHAIHTYWIGNLRLVLDAQLEPGNRHSPSHARAGLLALLEGMPKEQRPKLVCMLAYRHSGFSVDTSVRIEGHDRAGLERLLRYCARPAFSMERLRKAGKDLVYRCAKQHSEPASEKRGVKVDELILTPLELINRIAALVPPPRTHRHRYYGALAPNSPLRAAVTALAQAAPSQLVKVLAEPAIAGCDVLTQSEPAPFRRSQAHYLWAVLIARIYEVFPLLCPMCGGQMRIIAFITHSADIRQMLDHIGVQSEPPNIAPARGPPMWEDCDAQMGEGAQGGPDWDLAAQPAPDYEVDQRISW